MKGIKIISPYFREGKWLKANFHVHATPVSENTGYSDKAIIREYIKAGYSIVTFTEYNNIYSVTNCESEKNSIPDIILVPGFEKRAVMPMVVLISAKFDNEEFDNKECDNNQTKNIQEMQEYIDRQNEAGGLIFFAQPMSLSVLEEKLHYLKNLDGYAGIEILNGNLAFGNGSKRNGEDSENIMGYYSNGSEIDLWDNLLDSGKKVWGFGNDGLQKWGEFNSVFNLVKLSGNRLVTPGRIINALKVGSFAVSTGVRIKDITVDEGTINLMVENKFENKTYIAYGKERRILKTCCTKEDIFFYKPEGDEGYVRMQVIYESGKTLLTQPFFIE